jgi:uncharacterized protein YecE (DUF72 family)
VHVLTGTSGYSYTPWKGRFYPAKLPATKMLSYYAERFPTVEINNTFYRMPKPEQFEKWSAETPPGFAFAVKAPRRITHEKRLADAADETRRLFAAAAALGDKLGPVLFQLPPFLRKDLPRLEAFLATLAEIAPAARAAFEFRHESWFADDVFAALRARNAALCIADAEDFSVPLVATATWGYLRLRRQDYEDGALQAWADRLRGQPWDTAWVYFKHEEDGLGPKLAARMAQLARAPLRESVAPGQD